jgi:hypothetical protein
MRIVITDHRFANVDQERAIIEAAGGELVVGQCTSARKLIELCQRTDGILNVRVSAAVE